MGNALGLLGAQLSWAHDVGTPAQGESKEDVVDEQERDFIKPDKVHKDVLMPLTARELRRKRRLQDLL